MPYALKFDPATPLGRKFKQVALNTYEERSVAEHVRDLCTNRDSLIVVEVDEQGHESVSRNGESGKLGAQIKTAPTGALTPNAGASPTIKESTDG